MYKYLRSKFVQDTLILQVGKIGVVGMNIISGALVFRLLGVESYGLWTLAQSFYSVWLAFNLTGVSTSTLTQLPLAVGAKDTDEILNLMAYYVQLSLFWALGLTVFLMLAGPHLARILYVGDEQIGMLAAWLSLMSFGDAFYNLVILALQSRRSMRTVAILQNVNQVILVLSVILVLLVSPTAEGMVASRLGYSLVTMLIALAVYARLREEGAVPYPTLRAIIARARTISPRRYLGFGFANAVDKNIANLYTEIPLQLVGVISGTAAAGYLGLAMKAITLPNLFTSAVLDNLQAVVPQAIGRREFARLWRGLVRLTISLTAAGTVFYIVFALLSPALLPLIYDDKVIPAVPATVVLCVYGVITLVGGIFGPLYRAFYLLRSAIIVKLGTLLLMLPVGILLVQSAGEVGGAWMLNGLFLVSVALTAAFTLPVLKRHARET